MMIKNAQLVWAQILYLIPYNQTNCTLISWLLISDGLYSLDIVKPPWASKAITYRLMIRILICTIFIKYLVKYTKYCILLIAMK